ncbi:hypothetical protein [Devosia sp. CAU 1758]
MAATTGADRQASAGSAEPELGRRQAARNREQGAKAQVWGGCIFAVGMVVLVLAGPSLGMSVIPVLGLAMACAGARTGMSDSKTVSDFGVDGILSSMRRFMEEIPPMKTAKDIKFVTNGAYPCGFIVADGCRRGIYFMDEPEMRHFIKPLGQRADLFKDPIRRETLGSHSVGARARRPGRLAHGVRSADHTPEEGFDVVVLAGDIVVPLTKSLAWIGNRFAGATMTSMSRTRAATQ